VASGGTLVAVAAGVCLGAAYANLGKQGADYANDLGQHNWNPVDTAADGWAPYQNAIDTNRYDQLGQMTTGTALTWGGDALLIYGGIRGVQGASGGGATDAGAVDAAGLGDGSTIRAGYSRAPATLTDQLAVEQATSDPAAGVRLQNITMGDARWPADAGWVKMRQVINGKEIHYNYNPATGKVADPKIIGS
jgi:hypothetical protein